MSVSQALQQAYNDGNATADGNRPGSLWDWTKPIGLTRFGPSVIGLLPQDGVPGPGRATLSELEFGGVPGEDGPPQERYDASVQNGWYSQLEEATPEKNKYYQAGVVTLGGKKILGTVHREGNHFRIWEPAGEVGSYLSFVRSSRAPLSSDFSA